MRTVEFHRSLDYDNALRVNFDLEHGQVLKFMVQLECRFSQGNEWGPVIRYDTAHGFAHCDRLHPYEETARTRLATQEYDEALTFAIDELLKNWFISEEIRRMAQQEIAQSKGIVEWNILLTGKIMKYLMDNPIVFGSLPDKFELVILPDDDPEIRQYNLELLDKYGSEGKPIVFARLNTHPENLAAQIKPSIFVPVNVAA